MDCPARANNVLETTLNGTKVRAFQLEDGIYGFGCDEQSKSRKGYVGTIVMNF
jgi:hypothetical protein